MVGARIQDSGEYKMAEDFAIGTEPGEKYPIGSFGERLVFIDPYMKWGDMRVYNESAKELFDLKKLGFKNDDFI